MWVFGTLTRTFSNIMAEGRPPRYARLIAKVVRRWRAWRLAVELKRLAAKESKRLELRRRGLPVPTPLTVDLFDDADVVRAVGLSMPKVLCAPASAQDVVDRWSAARFCIDLWRRRGDLRARFPGSFAADGWCDWLQGEGQSELGLGNDALQYIKEALAARISDQARQIFLSSDAIHTALPHGLTPIGMRDLLRWFIRFPVAEKRLRLEEVWWLLLEAQARPEHELVRAYAFAPTWQQAHPDGLSVFGRDALSAWLAIEFGATGSWLAPASWPVERTSACQIREAYWARPRWREAWPNAFDDAVRARGFVAWLGSPEAGLDERTRDWCRRLDPQSLGDELTQFGFNIIGHFCYPSGLRVSAESLVEAARLAGIDVSLRDVHTDAKDDPRHADFDGMEWHDVTIIHAQPEPFFDETYRRSNLFEREPRTYRVGYWYWEFDSVPDAWIEHSRKVDEVWAATEFIAKGLRDKLSIPVRTLFPGVGLAPYERRGKPHFGLSESAYTFLFTFHMMSIMERKNPLGLIQAFKLAFQSHEPAQLVLKTSFGDRHPAQIQTLRKAAAGANIVLIDEIYSSDEALSLMDACDAYVSLHRSEGLGLTMAEAMLMGKPVIATNFSGNVDFMDESNSLLVPYKLMKLGKPIPPLWSRPGMGRAVDRGSSQAHAASIR
jgi:glycosyltransferase involved in cell wall biosynthesis